MTGPITVPASVLDALGGLTDDDPAVLMQLGTAFLRVLGPGAGGARGSHLLLPASAPALLRVLARYLGMTLQPGEVPRWEYLLDGWALGTVTDDEPANVDGGDHTDLPMAALAAVLIHVGGPHESP